jgi:hypothetical protein
MKTLLKKPASLLAVLTTVLAMTFISSCSDDSSGGDDPSSSSTPGVGGGNSSSSGPGTSSSSDTGDGTSSSSGTGTSSSSGTGTSSSSDTGTSSSSATVVEYCVIEEEEACYPSFTSSQCTTMGGSISTTCPSEYENSPKACFLYDKYCGLGYSNEVCVEEEGTVMEYSTCLQNVGAFTSGSCISGVYMDECNTNISQYYCEYMEGGTFINGACPTTGSCEYSWGMYETRCVNGLTPSQCENDHEGYFSFNACPIQYCGYWEYDEEDEEEHYYCEAMTPGSSDRVQNAEECYEEWGGDVVYESECDPEYKYSPRSAPKKMTKKK